MCLMCAANTFCYTCDLEVGKTLHTPNGLFRKSILEILSQIAQEGGGGRGTRKSPLSSQITDLDVLNSKNRTQKVWIVS